MPRPVRLILYTLAVALAAALAVYLTLPVRRVNIHSELVMLGDLDNDHAWTGKDWTALSSFLANPFSRPRLEALKADVNRNGLIDDEDILFLKALYESGDPYLSRSRNHTREHPFPYPREFFKYIPKSEYVQRPLYVLDHPIRSGSPLGFLRGLKPGGQSFYQDQLLAEIYDEAIRFSIAYDLRKGALTDVDRNFAARKALRCDALWKLGDLPGLLLQLIELVEDAETLTTKGQTRLIARTLYVRDHLRGLMDSPLYRGFKEGKEPSSAVLRAMEKLLEEDLGIAMDLESARPPRDFLKLANYVDRAKWQYYKSTSRRADFERLSLFAQYDRRYLRAVARTTPSHGDRPLENHNLPMVLLFREALRLKAGDKLAAIGLLDETIRVPFAWIKSIPRSQLPSSIALENFLLPGNKEDGPDKSRHWNVFGGISLYKSPEESIRLALAREVKDFRDEGGTPAAMTEFIRDTMANLNGIYHVVSIDPRLLYGRSADD
ncbi:MAG: hypothetical protein WC943_12225 [Elusimicrobiota bacterium]|jgi:hypothetical protein